MRVTVARLFPGPAPISAHATLLERLVAAAVAKGQTLVAWDRVVQAHPQDDGASVVTLSGRTHPLPPGAPSE